MSHSPVMIGADLAQYLDGWQWQRRVLFRPDGTELRRGTDARVDPACS